ncbi:MAG: tRNA dihydrouridine synthase DusB [Candidatus Omnitrophica bacterium]|nr:tRNA dihydrouridine synthase DusB [Candidatus Omnitrophota bacterium]
MLKVGNLKLKSNLILAPMAGVSDLPFRLLNRKFGAELAFVEMINCRSISHKSKRTQSMLSSTPQDRPLGLQLLGCEDKYILKALDVLKKYKFELIDFNAACPAKKVVRRQEGAGLLKDPKKLKKILKLVVKNSAVPVTVKIRTGWDKDNINAKEVALYAQDAGVNGLFIHGRTKTQGYSGSVDYKVIREVKKALSIPVIASGDILSAQLAKKMFDETGCDGLAIARGALGNPWIFKEIKEYLNTGKIIPKPGEAKIVKIMLEHLNASIAFYGERNGVIIFRKFFGWYTKGFRRIRPLREKSSRAKNKEEMTAIIEGCR